MLSDVETQKLDQALGLLTEIRVFQAEIKGALDVLMKAKDDHESRIRRLERAVWTASGTALLGGGGIGAVVAAILRG